MLTLFQLANRRIDSLERRFDTMELRFESQRQHTDGRFDAQIQLINSQNDAQRQQVESRFDAQIQLIIARTTRNGNTWKAGPTRSRRVSRICSSVNRALKV